MVSREFLAPAKIQRASDMDVIMGVYGNLEVERNVITKVKRFRVALAARVMPHVLRSGAYSRTCRGTKERVSIVLNPCVDGVATIDWLQPAVVVVCRS